MRRHDTRNSQHHNNTCSTTQQTAITLTHSATTQHAATVTWSSRPEQLVSSSRYASSFSLCLSLSLVFSLSLSLPSTFLLLSFFFCLLVHSLMMLLVAINLSADASSHRTSRQHIHFHSFLSFQSLYPFIPSALFVLQLPFPVCSFFSPFLSPSPPSLPLCC